MRLQADSQDPDAGFCEDFYALQKEKFMGRHRSGPYKAEVYFYALQNLTSSV